MFIRRNRIQLAQESAKIIIEEGVNDYSLAKKKAAQRLGLDDKENLPGNEEIDQALQEYHRIFRFQEQPEFIRKLRETALEIMEHLQSFAPRLVGSVLDGTAGAHSPILLHLFPETPEEVLIQLLQEGRPYKERPFSQIELGCKTLNVPVIEIRHNDRNVEIFLFPAKALRMTPSNHQKRASIKALKKLLADDNSPC